MATKKTKEVKVEDTQVESTDPALEALIEAYKKQNPAKAELKKAELEAKLKGNK